MKIKNNNKILIESFLLTLFAFFGFYIGDTLFDLANLNHFFLFIFWYLIFLISLYSIKYFLKLK